MQLFFVQADVFLIGRLRFPQDQILKADNVPQDQILKADNEQAVGDYAVLVGLVGGNCLTDLRALLVFFANRYSPSFRFKFVGACDQCSYCQSAIAL